MFTGEPLERVIDYPLEVDGEILKVTALQMGNPNCCVFVDDFNSIDWRRLGPLIENHPQFPERTNVIFIRVLDRTNIEERIWEILRVKKALFAGVFDSPTNEVSFESLGRKSVLQAVKEMVMEQPGPKPVVEATAPSQPAQTAA